MKEIVDKNILQRIKELFDQGLGARPIAEQLGMTRWAVQQYYKELGVYNIGRTKPRTVCFLTEKICKTCKIEKTICQFRQRTKGERISYEPYCLLCEADLNKISCNKRYQEKPELWQDYREKNSEHIASYDKEYRTKNKDAIAEKRNSNPEHKKYLRDHQRQRRMTDPAFNMRSIFSSTICKCLKKQGFMKTTSILKVLPYTMLELKKHMESLFEPWMTWENHGVYSRKNWNDNDNSTWTWQIDHIIPQSDLPYTSMEDENFKKCWALDNLRPYSAKQNLLDGTKRTRHKI